MRHRARHAGPPRPLFTGALLAAALFGLSGCSIDAAPGIERGAPAPGEAFTGPYASEFEQAFRHARTEAERDVLADGQITEAEAQEILESFRLCLDAVGITLIEHTGDSVEMEGDPARIPPEQIDERAETCSQETGEAVILTLYAIMRQDPGHEFTPERVVECLVRAGVVPESFTVDEYTSSGIERLHPGQQLYTDAGAETQRKLSKCESDPIASFIDEATQPG